MSTPMPSPSHHISHAETALDQALTWLSDKAVVPTDALIAVPPSAPTMTSARTCRRRVSDGWNPRTFDNTQALATGPAVWPAAMPMAAKWGIGLKKLATNAPAATAGHTRYPSRRIAASAMPAGGQTGEM